MSISTKLLQDDEDLFLTESELALRGTRLSGGLGESSSNQVGSELGNGNQLEKLAAKELLQRSRLIVDAMKVRGLPEPQIIRPAFAIKDLLGGEGFLTGRGIVEVTGEASSGKTQLLLDIALSCPRKAAYIYTEGRFPGDRLSQLASFKSRWPTSSMDRVLISTVADLDQLMGTLNKGLPHLLRTQPIDAVIIDSITWPFRVEDGCKERTKSIQDAARILHRLSKDHNVLVVCANHIAADLSTGGVRPCLGSSWSKGLSGRLVLSIKNRDCAIRNCRVDWCENYLPWKIGAERDFQIRSEGLIASRTSEN